jgi:hypothetical protein
MPRGYDNQAARSPRLVRSPTPCRTKRAAIADEHTALVTSANLTGAAQDHNMELGVHINGGPIPRRLARHYRALMASGVLVAGSRRICRGRNRLPAQM